MLLAIGNGVTALQDYTLALRTDNDQSTITATQGDPIDTCRLYLRDPVSSFPITTDDDLLALDENDPNGWPTVNLLQNPSFEGTYSSGVAPSWISFVATGATYSANTSTPIYGATAQQITISNVANSTHLYVLQQITLPTDQNGLTILAQPYCFSLWAAITQGFFNCAVSVSIEWWTAGFSSFISSTATTLFSSSSGTLNWRRYSVTSTPPSTAVCCKVVVNLNTNNASNGGTIIVDGAQLEYCTFGGFPSTAFAPNIQSPVMASHSAPATLGSTTALSLFATNTASTTLSTAQEMIATGGSVGLANKSILLGTATGWGELYSQGNAGAWAAAGGIGSPSGHGFFFDPNTLDGKTLVAGNWTQAVQLQLSAANTITATIVGRWWIYDPATLTYTALGTSTLSAQTINNTSTAYSLPAAAVAQTNIGPGQRLYVDIWLDVTANTGGNGTLNVQLNSLGTDSGKGSSQQAVVTTGYATNGFQVADGWFASALLTGMWFTSGPVSGRTAQTIQFIDASSASGQTQFTRGIAQDFIAFNPNATYTLTLGYRILGALTSPATVSIGINYEDANGNTLLGDSATIHGPLGEGVSTNWESMSVRIGPGTPHIAPAGTRVLKIFAGVATNTTSPISGTVALSSIQMVPDLPWLQTNMATGFTALTAGMYPTPYCDASQPGCYVDSGINGSGLPYRQFRIFGGLVGAAIWDWTDGPEAVLELDGSNYGVLLDEAPANLILPTQSDFSAIQQVFNYAAAQHTVQGIDFTTFVANIQNINGFVANWTTVRDVMNKICNQTVAAYWVDAYKRLHYQPALAVEAPFALSDTPDLVSSFSFYGFKFTRDSTQSSSSVVVEGSDQLSAPQTATYVGVDATLSSISAALSGNIGSGVTSLPVTSGGGQFYVGQKVTLGYNTAAAEIVTIASGSTATSIALSAATVNAHNSADTVQAGALDTHCAYTSLNVAATSHQIPDGTKIVVGYTGTQFVVTVSNGGQTVPSGSTTIPISSATPSVNYAGGTLVAIGAVVVVNTFIATTTTSTIAPAGTNLSADALVGATSLTVTGGGTAFTSGMPITIAGNEAAVVAAGATNTNIPLQHALAFKHLSGDAVYSLYQSLPVNPLTVSLPQNAVLALGSLGGQWQWVTTSGQVAQGATSIPVFGFDPLHTYSSGASVQASQPIAQVDSISVSGSGAGTGGLVIGLASVNTFGQGFSALYSPTDASITFQTAFGASQTATLVHRYDSPVLTRLTNPSVEANVPGSLRRRKHLHIKATEIRSQQAAIDRANAELLTRQKQRPSTYAFVKVPPWPVCTPFQPATAVRLSYSPKGISNQLFQVQQVVIHPRGNGSLIYELTLGYYQPSFAIQLAQAAKDLAYQGTNIIPTTVLEDVQNIQDAWTLSDNTSAAANSVGSWAPPNVSRWSGTYVWT